MPLKPCIQKRGGEFEHGFPQRAHEFRQRWVSYQSGQHGDAVSQPVGFYCIHCLQCVSDYAAEEVVGEVSP